MAEGKISPWMVGGIVVGGIVVLYVLYAEYQAYLTQAASNTANTTASADEATATGVVQSAIPDQEVSSSPSYPANASVTSSGTVTGTSTAEPTGQPGTVATGPAASTGSSQIALPALPVLN